MVRSNKKEYAIGKAYYESLSDSLQFLARPVRTLRSDHEVAALSYLALRPWRQTADHFQNILQQQRRLANHPDEEVQSFLKDSYDSLVGSPVFRAMAELVPIPRAMGEFEHEAFGHFTSLHKREMESNAALTVGGALSNSSRAAAQSVMEHWGKQRRL